MTPKAPPPLYCGEAISQRLHTLGMRRVDLAAALDVSESVVSFWIVNRKPVPSYRILPLAAVLQVDPEWLETQAECYEHNGRPEVPLLEEVLPEPRQVRPGTATLSGYTIGGALFMEGVR